MRRIAITLLIILIVLIGGALIAPQFMDWNAYRARIAEQVKSATGFELTIKGDLDLAVLPYPRLQASDVALRSPRSETPVLKLDGITLDIAMMPLLSSRIEVDTLSLDSPRLSLKVLPDGSGNWMTDKLARAGADNRSDNGREQTSLSAFYQRIGLQNVSVQDGAIRFIHSPSGRDYMLKDFNADIDAKTLFGPYSIDARYNFRDSPLTASAKIGRYTSNQASLPLKLTLKAGQASAELKYSGVADFGEEKPVLQGEVRLTADKLRKLALLAPANIKLPAVLAGTSLTTEGMITSDATGTRLEDMRLELGSVGHQGHIKVDYSDPHAIRVDTKMLPMSGEKAKMPSAGIWKALAKSGIEGQAIIQPSRYALRNTHLVTAGQRHAIEFIYALPDGDSKPTLDVTVDGATLDLDKVGLTKAAKPQAQDTRSDKTDNHENAGALLKRLAGGVESPLHITADIAFNAIRVAGHRFDKPAMKFEVRHERLNIETLALADAYNASWRLQGKVADINAVSGIDLRANVETARLDQFAKALLGERADNYQLSGEASARVALEGNADELDVTSNLEAMKLRAETSARLEQVLKAPKLASGNFRIRHPDSAELVRIVAPDYQAPPLLKRPIDVYGDIASVENKHYKLEKLSGRILGTNIKGHLGGRLKDGGKPHLKGDIEFTRLDLSGLAQPGAGAPPQGADDTGDSEGKGVVFSRKAIDLQALHALDADLGLSGRTLTYADWVINNPEFQVKLADGKLTLEKTKGTLFGGDLDLSGTIQAGAEKGQGMSADIKAEAKNVDARAMSNALTGTKLDVLEGNLTIDSTLATSGVSPAALVLALNGEGSITSSDFMINGIELNALAHALREDVSTQDAVDNLMAFMRSPFQGGATRFTGINGEFEIDKGVVSLKNTKLEAKGFVMTSKGTINLPRWQLDLMNTVTFPGEKDVPSFDIIVRGPLDEPARGLRDQMMRNYLEQRINNKARRFVTEELNKLFGGDLKTRSEADRQKQDSSAIDQDKVQKSTSDAKTGQESGTLHEGDTDTGKRERKDQNNDQRIETIRPQNMKDGQPDERNSKFRTIKPEDAIRGVIDRLEPSDKQGK